MDIFATTEEIRKEGDILIYGKPKLTDNERDFIEKLKNDELFACNRQCDDCPFILEGYKEQVNPYGSTSSCIFAILEGRCDFSL